MSATLEEFLAAAEYIVAEGNARSSSASAASAPSNGRRATPSTSRRGPLILQPGDATCPSSSIPATPRATATSSTPMAKAALVVGAHGVMVEVHPDPDKALCDGPQSLDPAGFAQLMAMSCARLFAAATSIGVQGHRA